jgi:hypothetical protein
VSRTRKQPYRKSRRFDRTCRCHGGCPACLSNRTIQAQRAMASVKAQLREEVA